MGGAKTWLRSAAAFERPELFTIQQSLGGWCNGSTADSESVCLGSNPSPPVLASGQNRVPARRDGLLLTCSPDHLIQLPPISARVLSLLVYFLLIEAVLAVLVHLKPMARSINSGRCRMNASKAPPRWKLTTQPTGPLGPTTQPPVRKVWQPDAAALQ